MKKIVTVIRILLSLNPEMSFTEFHNKLEQITTILYSMSKQDLNTTF